MADEMTSNRVDVLNTYSKDVSALGKRVADLGAGAASDEKYSEAFDQAVNQLNNRVKYFERFERPMMEAGMYDNAANNSNVGAGTVADRTAASSSTGLTVAQEASNDAKYDALFVRPMRAFSESNLNSTASAVVADTAAAASSSTGLTAAQEASNDAKYNVLFARPMQAFTANNLNSTASAVVADNAVDQSAEVRSSRGLTAAQEAGNRIKYFQKFEGPLLSMTVNSASSFSAASELLEDDLLT